MVSSLNICVTHTAQKLIAGMLLLCIWGCNFEVYRDVPPPEEAIAEIRVHGVTFAPSTLPYPLVTGPEFEAVNARYSTAEVGEEPYVVFSLLRFYFSPHPEYEIVDDSLGPIHNPRGNFPYEYSFSIQTGSEYVEIPKTEDEFDPDQSPNNYDGSVRSGGYPDEFVVVGNHIYNAVVISMPARATHIEFWYRERRDAERELVRRVALENLKAWRMYIKPIIDENQI